MLNSSTFSVAGFPSMIRPSTFSLIYPCACWITASTLSGWTHLLTTLGRLQRLAPGSSCIRQIARPRITAMLVGGSQCGLGHQDDLLAIGRFHPSGIGVLGGGALDDDDHGPAVCDASRSNSSRKAGSFVSSTPNSASRRFRCCVPIACPEPQICCSRMRHKPSAPTEPLRLELGNDLAGDRTDNLPCRTMQLISVLSFLTPRDQNGSDNARWALSLRCPCLYRPQSSFP
jgi:hypothetical protein